MCRLPPEPSPLLLAREQRQETLAQRGPRSAHSKLLATAVSAPDSVWLPLSEEKKNRAGEPRRSEEHTSELQSRRELVCRLLLEKKKAPVRTRSQPASAR